MSWFQTEISLTPKRRGFHLVTGEVLEQLPELRSFDVGMMQVFILHTSASITLNENCCPDVLHDFEAHFNQMVPERQPYYQHTMEGPDDMPAHIKSSLLGSSLSLPIRRGAPYLGTWQGIYLCEHRDHGGARRLVVTISGQKS